MPSAHARGYTARWRKARALFLYARPLCLYCERMGKIVGATVVDHIIPHKGDYKLFWDQHNWQPLCKRCHDSIKQKEEGGKVVGCDTSGVPVHRLHHWMQ